MTDRDQRFAEDVSQPTPSPQEALPEKPTPEQHAQRTKVKKVHFFAAFCENPENINFLTQEPNEHVLLFLRKSMWINVPWILTTAVFLFIPLVLYFLRSSFLAIMPSLTIIFLLIPLYYILVALYAFVNFITWYYNAALITDMRVIDIDFHQLVFKDVAETKLSLVQDVSYNQVGVLPNMLGYGYVLIQTAGTLDNFEFYNLPQPARIEEVVEALIGKKGGLTQ